MENKILEDIKEYAIKKLNNANSFCGVCIMPNEVLLNSTTPEGIDVKIVIKEEISQPEKP